MSKNRERKPKNGPLPAAGAGEPERAPLGRSEPEPAAGAGAANRPAPSPEVPAKPSRRRHTAEYKARIIREADACAPGGIGAILRREGLYASQLAAWRRQQDAGFPQKRGRKASNGPKRADIERLERKASRLAEELRKAKLIIEVQKKLCIALGLEPHPGLEAE